MRKQGGFPESRQFTSTRNLQEIEIDESEGPASKPKANKPKKSSQPYEIEYSQLVVEDFVGRGFYGEVYRVMLLSQSSFLSSFLLLIIFLKKGKWNNIPVAIKKLTSSVDSLEKWQDEVELL